MDFLFTYTLPSALEFILKSKSNQNGNIDVNDFILILRQIYNGIEFESTIKEASRLAMSGGTEMNCTKFIAFIEMVYLKKKPKLPIAISLHYVLDQLRVQCLSEKGDYIKAGQVQEQIDTLLQSESLRRRQDITTRQTNDMTSLKRAHDEQYINFNEGR